MIKHNTVYHVCKGWIGKPAPLAYLMFIRPEDQNQIYCGQCGFTMGRPNHHLVLWRIMHVANQRGMEIWNKNSIKI